MLRAINGFAQSIDGDALLMDDRSFAPPSTDRHRRIWADDRQRCAVDR